MYHMVYLSLEVIQNFRIGNNKNNIENHFVDEERIQLPHDRFAHFGRYGGREKVDPISDIALQVK